MANWEILAGSSSDTVNTGITGKELSDFTFTPTVQSHLSSTDGGTLELAGYNSSTGEITIKWTSGVTPSTTNFSGQTQTPYSKGTISLSGAGGSGDPHMKPIFGKGYTI